MVKVSKTFTTGKTVLKDIYLSFFYGAKIGILGLNGAGKSTLLKIIAGLEKSFQGDVVFRRATPSVTCHRSPNSTRARPRARS